MLRADNVSAFPLCIRVVLPDADRSRLATLRLIRSTIQPKAVVVHSEFRSLLLPATRLVARRDSQNYAEKIKSGLSPAPTSHPPVPNRSGSTRHNPALGIRPVKSPTLPCASASTDQSQADYSVATSTSTIYPVYKEEVEPACSAASSGAPFFSPCHPVPPPALPHALAKTGQTKART